MYWGGVYAGIRRIPTSGFLWQRILASVIINKQGTFRPFATLLCVYPPSFLAIHTTGCRHNYSRHIGECGKLKGCNLHIRPILNMFGHLALLLVPGGSFKVGAWIRPVGLYKLRKNDWSVTDSFVKFAELKLTTVDRCSSANWTNIFLIGAVHRTAPIIIGSYVVWNGVGTRRILRLSVHGTGFTRERLCQHCSYERSVLVGIFEMSLTC